jgi:DNA mismatch endonuclease (patch repair protein)
MSRVRQANTDLELVVRKFLFKKGFRYRKNDKRLPGSPDIVLPKYRTAIFVHGCFWHGHRGCKASRLPKTRKKIWADKIFQNVKRDRRFVRQLKKFGWNVIIVWGCELKNKDKKVIRLENLIKEIAGFSQTGLV